MSGDRKKGKVANPVRAFWLALLVLLLPVTPAGGQGLSLQKADKGPINIVSDRLAYDQESDTIRAEGDVVITFTGGYLKADSVTMNRTTNDSWAHGHALLFSEGDTLEGDLLEINLETKNGFAHDGRMFYIKNHLYVTGSEIEKTGEATYRIKDATATTCDGPMPDWQFTGKEADVTIDGYGKLTNGTFQIRDTPVAWFPWAMFPAKTSRQSGFLFPYLGYSEKKLGLDVDVPFYWAISDNYDATLYTRYMSMRGLQEGLEFRYFPSASTWGLFYGDFLKDQWTGTDTTSTNTVPRTWTEKQDRWSWYWSHETTFEPGFYFRADLMRISDIYYFQDFSSHNYYLDNYAGAMNRPFQRISFLGNDQLTSYDSTARIVKQWRNYNLTALTQYTENLSVPNNDNTLQRYPEITFNGFKQPLFGTRLNWEFTSLYGYYYRTLGEKGSVFDVYPKLSLPWSFGDYLQVTPTVGVRETLWDTESNDPATPGSSASRSAYTLALNTSTEAFRIFDVSWGEVEKVRHAIKPEITYNYIPSAGPNFRPDFVLPVSYTTVGGVAANVDAQNSITYALTNTLISRLRDEKGNVNYREVFRLKLSQTYNITTPTIYVTPPTLLIPTIPPSQLPADPTKTFMPIDLEVDINPYQYLAFATRSSYDVNTTSWAQIQQDIALKDTRGDSLAFVYRYTKNSVESAGILGRIRATNSVDVFGGVRENLFDRTTLEKTIGLEYRRQCWAVEVSYSDLVNDRTFMVLFSLSGLGRVGGFSASRQVMGF
jgi:LPS-assembly protein